MYKVVLLSCCVLILPLLHVWLTARWSQAGWDPTYRGLPVRRGGWYYYRRGAGRLPRSRETPLLSPRRSDGVSVMPRPTVLMIAPVCGPLFGYPELSARAGVASAPDHPAAVTAHEDNAKPPSQPTSPTPDEDDDDVTIVFI